MTSSIHGSACVLPLSALTKPFDLMEMAVRLVMVRTLVFTTDI
jgi:hypothetical protein